jgi:hypothetical protein
MNNSTAQTVQQKAKGRSTDPAMQGDKRVIYNRTVGPARVKRGCIVGSVLRPLFKKETRHHGNRKKESRLRRTVDQ